MKLGRQEWGHIISCTIDTYKSTKRKWRVRDIRLKKERKKKEREREEERERDRQTDRK
jgi:hypothetical protein